MNRRNSFFLRATVHTSLRLRGSSLKTVSEWKPLYPDTTILLTDQKIMSDDDDSMPNNGALLDDEEDDDDDNDDDNPLSSLPSYVIPRVAKLQELDETREKIMEEYLAERAALEKKYSARLQPLFDTRAQIICGDQDDAIAKEEANKPKNEDEKKEDDSAAMQESDEVIKGVPQFWICAMTQLETIGEMITEEDVDCLEHLKNITCTDNDDGKGFTLRFHFGPNEYFHDTVLTKKYEVPNLLTSDEPILKAVEGCKIQWKPDKSLTFKTIKKKQRGKGKNAGQVRTVTKTEKKESFFQWFDPPKMPSMDDMDEEEAEQLEELFDSDYEVAQAFRSQLIPRAVLWFTGEVRSAKLYLCLWISSLVSIAGVF